MCATHNVTACTQMIMTEEFKKGEKPQIFGASNVFIPRFSIGSGGACYHWLRGVVRAV
jgi:hypothetical protein